MSYGGQPALDRLQRRLTIAACLRCAGDGYYLLTRTASEWGHACGGDERECARSCPIEIPVEVQEQVLCGACRGTGRRP